MAFPPEFQYANEGDFIQRLLIPLLQRLGYSLVVNYHGTLEYGKDLLFAEVDRFGHVRYHGLQAKYESSISLNEVETLITDCKQAFNNTFRHPQTGAEEVISSFYAVNGGAVSPQATEHYFASLRKLYGGNVHLLQGKDLVTLDRWAAVNQGNAIGSALSGLLLEIRYNRRALITIQDVLNQGRSTPQRLRTEALSRHLTYPIVTDSISIDRVVAAWQRVAMMNQLLDELAAPLSLVPVVERLKSGLSLLISTLPADFDALETEVVGVIQRLGPLVAS
jgi:hypothetical protein